jgi:hypothetical protein
MIRWVMTQRSGIPGTYVIRAQSDKYLSREESKTVTLSRGQKLTVNLVFDTGIS